MESHTESHSAVHVRSWAREGAQQPQDDQVAQSTTIRELPHNLDAEQALLGAVLLAPGALSNVSGWLTPEHFHVAVQGRIYAAALALADRGAAVNAVTLAHYFREDGDLEDVGGARYLAKLASSAVTIINAPHYARLILELAARRRIIELGNQAIEAAFELMPDSDTATLAADAIAGFDGCLDMLASTERRATSLAVAMEASLATTEAAVKAGSHITGVPSGLANLDELTGGLHAGELIIAAARPGMGKTALALGIARAAAKAGHPTVFFSLEMAPTQLAQRILASDSGVAANAQRRGRINPEQYATLEHARRRNYKAAIDLIDAAGMSAQVIAATARRIHRRRRLGLVIVDYLGLVQPSESAQRRNRENEVSEISAGLKRLARELGVPVLALSQLSRAVESRENKRPRLSDLRDSGSIEQDADVVMFIYREAEYLRRERPDPGQDSAGYADWKRKYDALRHVAELIVDKQRQGPSDTIELRYDAERMTFSDRSTVTAQGGLEP